MLMHYAELTTNLLDLWTEPRYNSERASQLFFAEPLLVKGEQKKGFVEVQQVDGYTGWADERFLKECSKEEFAKFNSKTNSIVKVAQAGLFDKNKHSVPPHFLYYGTKLIATSGRDGLKYIDHPERGVSFLKSSNLRPITKREPATGRKLVAEARKWLGVPYLWGGMTPAGFDCSGFLRQLFAQFNIYLPRDTKEQILAGRKVERQSIKMGDLVFFKRHVGLAISPNQIIHCSVGSVGVSIESIEPGLPDYRLDLDSQFATARRLV